MTDLVLAKFVAGVLIALVHEEIVTPWVRRRLMLAPRRGSMRVVVFDAVWFGGFAVALQSALLAGGGLVYVVYDLWRWWNDDDNEKRRDKVAAKLRTPFRVFAPSPIPTPSLRSIT